MGIKGVKGVQEAKRNGREKGEIDMWKCERGNHMCRVRAGWSGIGRKNIKSSKGRANFWVCSKKWFFDMFLTGLYP